MVLGTQLDTIGVFLEDLWKLVGVFFVLSVGIGLVFETDFGDPQMDARVQLEFKFEATADLELLEKSPVKRVFLVVYGRTIDRADKD